MASITSVTLEVADLTAAQELLRRRLRSGPRAAAAGDRRTDDRLPRIHALADRVPAGRRPGLPRRGRRRRRDHAQAGREVAVGLRRRRAGAGRDDLEGRDRQEEGHRPGHPRVRQDRAAAGRVGRRPRPSGSTSTTATPWRAASAASTSSSSRPSGAITLGLYGRRALAKDAGVPDAGSGSHRLVIDGDVGLLHRPGRVRVGRRAGPGGRLVVGLERSLLEGHDEPAGARALGLLDTLATERADQDLAEALEERVPFEQGRAVRPGLAQQRLGDRDRGVEVAALAALAQRVQPSVQRRARRART